MSTGSSEHPVAVSDVPDASGTSTAAAPHVPLSVLDLVPISEGMSTADAIENSMADAWTADQAGYHRYWFAEHHNTNSLASSATALLIARAAGVTERIRVGSGGIMLPNHAPLAVAEEFGTLVQMFGDRIDLGLGRAPGTDPLTAQLLSRTSAAPEAFMSSVAQMRDWSRPADQQPQGLRIAAPVAAGTEIPMWVLGSTVNGATLAGRLGLPFAVASHFAPFQFHQALEVYREEFDPDAATAQISEPHTMVGVNVMVAETDQEAVRQFTTHQQMFLGTLRGDRRKIQPPLDAAGMEDLAAPDLLAKVDQTLSIRAVGSPQTVTDELEQLVAATGADELITTTYTFDPADRNRSLTLLAHAWGLDA
jgi:luciferase family oxidoreductase group 1